MGVARVAVDDTELGGCPIHAGDQVMIMLGSANTDEAEFDDADVVRFDREVNRHLAFGGGIHRCLGSHLARQELRIALREWHRRIPEYSVADGHTLVYTAGHPLDRPLPDGLHAGPVIDRVRLGVVGVGNVAALNVAGYLEHPRCDVVALCDPRVDVARKRADEWGVPDVYGDLDDLLADDTIDAVEILTPTHLHHDHVLAALAAGKHVSVQKPIANTVADARTMAEAALAAGRHLRVSECYCHYPPLERARQLIRDGAIGHPTAIRIKTVVGQTDSAFQAGLQAEGYVWRLNDQSPGGHLFDDMVHKYAMASWLVDQDIVAVQAAVRRRDLFFEPCAAIFEYEDA